jgi:hypothetical protein
MGNFWKKSSHLCIGLILGSICGLASTYNLELLGALWRPPALFCVAFTILWAVYWREDLVDLLSILGLFWVIYWISLFGGQIHAGIMTLGAILSFWAIHHFLRLKKSTFLKIAVVILFAFGLAFDFGLLKYFLGILVGKGWEVEYRFEDDIGLGVNIIIFIWQTIALGAISLQFYTEKRHQQDLVATAYADGQGDVVPTEHN